MSAEKRRIGILAGGGTLPRAFADEAAKRGELAQIVAIGESADTDFGPYRVARVSMGQIGRMLRVFKAAGVSHIVIIGPVRRADISRIRPDLGFILNLPAILRIISSGGDDSALRGVVRFFEAKGFGVLGPADVAPGMLAPSGSLTKLEPGAADAADIAIGFDVIRRLGPFDIGQAAVVTQGRVQAIEGAEGTNAMLERLARRGSGLAGSGSRRGGVLVKRPKPGQELRVDTPSIGPGTLSRAADAGLNGVAVLSGGVLIAEREEVVRLADERGLFACGMADGAAASAVSDPVANRPSLHLQRLGDFAPGERESAEMKTALAVIERVKPFDCGGAIVAARGHVLAVEAGGEGAADVLQRVATWRMRDGQKRRRKAGVAVLAQSQPVDVRIISMAGAAGLKGLAIVGREARVRLSRDAIMAANQLGLFLVALDDRTPETS